MVRESNADHTMFITVQIRKITLLIVYVDDMVVTGDDPHEVSNLKAQLIKDLGPLHYFLGIEVARSNSSILSLKESMFLITCRTDTLGCTN